MLTIYTNSMIADTNWLIFITYRRKNMHAYIRDTSFTTMQKHAQEKVRAKIKTTLM